MLDLGQRLLANSESRSYKKYNTVAYSRFYFVCALFPVIFFDNIFTNVCTNSYLPNSDLNSDISNELSDSIFLRGIFQQLDIGIKRSPFIPSNQKPAIFLFPYFWSKVLKTLNVLNVTCCTTYDGTYNEEILFLLLCYIILWPRPVTLKTH